MHRPLTGLMANKTVRRVVGKEIENIAKYFSIDMIKLYD